MSSRDSDRRGHDEKRDDYGVVKGKSKLDEEHRQSSGMSSSYEDHGHRSSHGKKSKTRDDEDYADDRYEERYNRSSYPYEERDGRYERRRYEEGYDDRWEEGGDLAMDIEEKSRKKKSRSSRSIDDDAEEWLRQGSKKHKKDRELTEDTDQETVRKTGKSKWDDEDDELPSPSSSRKEKHKKSKKGSSGEKKHRRHHSEEEATTRQEEDGEIRHHDRDLRLKRRDAEGLDDDNGDCGDGSYQDRRAERSERSQIGETGAGESKHWEQRGSNERSFNGGFANKRGRGEFSSRVERQRDMPFSPGASSSRNKENHVDDRGEGRRGSKEQSDDYRHDDRRDDGGRGHDDGRDESGRGKDTRGGFSSTSNNERDRGRDTEARGSKRDRDDRAVSGRSNRDELSSSSSRRRSIFSDAPPVELGGPALPLDKIQLAQEIARQISQGKTVDLKNIQVSEVSKQIRPGGTSGGDKIKNKIYMPVAEQPNVNFIGLIIGPRGRTLQQMEQESGAKILVRGQGAGKASDAPQPDDDEELHVLVVGETQEQVDKASRLVCDLVFQDEESRERFKRSQLTRLHHDDGQSETFDRPREVFKSATVTVPARSVGLVIGRNGETIRELQGRSGAEIKVEREDNGTSERKVFVHGSDEQIAIAKRLIFETVGRDRNPGGGGTASSSLGSLGGEGRQVFVPHNIVGLIIGRGGANVKFFQEQSNAKVVIEQQPYEKDPSSRLITLLGQRKSVECARQMLMEKVEEIFDERPHLIPRQTGRTLHESERTAFLEEREGQSRQREQRQDFQPERQQQQQQQQQPPPPVAQDGQQPDYTEQWHAYYAMLAQAQYAYESSYSTMQPMPPAGPPPPSAFAASSVDGGNTGGVREGTGAAGPAPPPGAPPAYLAAAAAGFLQTGAGASAASTAAAGVSPTMDVPDDLPPGTTSDLPPRLSENLPPGIESDFPPGTENEFPPGMAMGAVSVGAGVSAATVGPPAAAAAALPPLDDGPPGL